MLIANPSLLPSKEIDESWDNLIPLGREVPVTAGAIDNLYITPEGLICLVETKLWRNPEAHRTVVAQIIDYAKDLSKMTFDEFKNSVEKSTLHREKYNFGYRISKYIKEIDQVEFQSKIQENLSRGRFLLLIVGDRIYPEVAMLLDTIQSAPNLEFKIGLIELQMFKTSKENPWPLLIIPAIVGKTYEVTRAVVKILYEEKRPETEVDAFEEGAPKAKINKRTFEKSMQKDYADIFIPLLDQWIVDGFNISWGTTGFSVRFFWKGKSRSIIDLYSDYLSLFTEDMVRKRGFPLEPYHEYRNEIDKIPTIRRLFTEGRRYAKLKDITLEEFSSYINVTDRMIRNIKKLE
ncbi:MAG: hypothetical protein HQ555_10315 [Candidatus Aminicenantes bacterium]|nr:hypothetical protein [Candidatus Aminicenantes bacterium]